MFWQLNRKNYKSARWIGKVIFLYSGIKRGICGKLI